MALWSLAVIRVFIAIASNRYLLRRLNLSNCIESSGWEIGCSVKVVHSFGHLIFEFSFVEVSIRGWSVACLAHIFDIIKDHTKLSNFFDV